MVLQGVFEAPTASAPFEVLFLLESETSVSLSGSRRPQTESPQTAQPSLRPGPGRCHSLSKLYQFVRALFLFPLYYLYVIVLPGALEVDWGIQLRSGLFSANEALVQMT